MLIFLTKSNNNYIGFFFAISEDKPEGGIPFYCPLCGFTIEEKATYDGVFQHNKQLHNMNDEDAETLAKGFTYSNSPPTSEESKENIQEDYENWITTVDEPNKMDWIDWAFGHGYSRERAKNIWRANESKANEKGVLGGDLFSRGVGGVWDNISREGRHKLISMNIYEFLDSSDVKLTTQVLALEETGQNLKWDEIPSDVRRPLEKAIIAFAEKLWLTKE